MSIRDDNDFDIEITEKDELVDMDAYHYSSSVISTKGLWSNYVEVVVSTSTMLPKDEFKKVDEDENDEPL